MVNLYVCILVTLAESFSVWSKAKFHFNALIIDFWIIIFLDELADFHLINNVRKSYITSNEGDIDEYIV